MDRRCAGGRCIRRSKFRVSIDVDIDGVSVPDRVRWWMEVDGANSRESLVDAHPQLPRGELQLAPLSPEALTFLPYYPYVAVVCRMLYICIFHRNLFPFLCLQLLASPLEVPIHISTRTYRLFGDTAINIERSQHQ